MLVRDILNSVPVAYWYVEGRHSPLRADELENYMACEAEVIHDADIDEDGLDLGINWAIISPRKEC